MHQIVLIEEFEKGGCRNQRSQTAPIAGCSRTRGGVKSSVSENYTSRKLVLRYHSDVLTLSLITCELCTNIAKRGIQCAAWLGNLVLVMVEGQILSSLPLTRGCKSDYNNT